MREVRVTTTEDARENWQETFRVLRFVNTTLNDWTVIRLTFRWGDGSAASGAAVYVGEPGFGFAMQDAQMVSAIPLPIVAGASAAAAELCPVEPYTVPAGKQLLVRFGAAAGGVEARALVRVEYDEVEPV